MTPAVDLSSLPAPAQKILEPSAPAQMRAMAAKGVIPGLKSGDIVTVVAILTESADKAVAETARTTFSALPKLVLDGALSAELQPGVIDLLAMAYSSNSEVLSRLLQMPNMVVDTVVRIAAAGSEAVCELIATNESRLLAHPAIIEALYMNRHTRMSTADRVLELAVRHGLELTIPAFKEAATAVREELIAEPSEEPTPDDIVFKKADELAAKIQVDLEKEDTHQLDDKGNEAVTAKCRPLWVQLGEMTVSQKIRRALLGTSTERMMLVRDSNRLVSSAAVRSPMIQEPEVVRISGSRSVDSDVLRIIATNRDWTRSYQVKVNLVSNPRTPFSLAIKLLPLLREHELKAIAKSKNVTGAIATAARQSLQRRDGKS